MNILMIGIGAEVIVGGGGGAQKRHLDYAQQVGHLTMVVSSFRNQNLRPTRLSDCLMVLPTNSRNKICFLWDAWRLGRAKCKSRSIDLIVTQDPFATALVGWLLKCWFNIPLLIGNHSAFIKNSYWIRERPFLNRIFHRIATFLLLRADGTRVVNPYQKVVYNEIGVSEKRIWFQPTPVPIESFLSFPSRQLQNNLQSSLSLNEKRVLLWVGNPKQQVKDLTTLFKAIDHSRSVIPELVLLLVGDFSKVSSLRKLASNLEKSSNIIFIGPVDHTKLPIYYHACEIYVHSSTYEGLAKVMVEAAASAKPIVSTNFKGVEGIVIEGKNGLLAPIGDSKKLADCILALLNDPERAKAMGKAGRNRVKTMFQHQKMIDGVVGIWRQIVLDSGRKIR